MAGEPVGTVTPSNAEDPGVVLPPAVVAQRDRANALIANLNGTTTLSDPSSPANPQNLPQPPAHGDVVQPSLDVQRPTHPTPPSFQLNPQPNGQGTEPPVTQGLTEPTNWEHLYRSLKGRWDQEMPALRQSVQTAMGRAQQLEQMLASLNQQPAQPNGNGHADDPVDVAGLFTEEEREQWGDEMLTTLARVVDRRTQAAAQRVTQPLIDRQQQTQQQQVEAYLDQQVPNWREINYHPAFMEWSLLSDPFSGAIRRDLLQRAFLAGDAPRVVHFFRVFLQEASAAPATQPSPPQQAAPVPPAPLPAQAPPASQRIQLTDLAAPSGAGATAGTPPPPAAKRVYRRSEIAQFYTDKALGKFSTPDLQAQANAVEQDLFLAGREGRVVNG